jgi:hypothetical protein
MNSPWGVMWGVQRETGWTDEYLLWETSWVNIRMKLADAPRYSYSKSARTIDSEDEMIQFLEQ